MLRTIDQIKQANRRKGHHFFEAGTMRFFDSRVLYPCFPCKDGSYFVTSERFDHLTPRLYTIRFCRNSGSIDTVSVFQEFNSAKVAKRHAAQLAAK